MLAVTALYATQAHLTAWSPWTSDQTKGSLACKGKVDSARHRIGAQGTAATSRPDPVVRDLLALLRLRGSADVTSEVERAISAIAAASVQIPRTEEVRDYLSRYPELTDFVERAALSAERRFGGRAVLSLELYRDREIEDEYLTLYVRMAKYSPDIMEAIAEIRGEFGEELAGIHGWFHVGTDFRPPRQ